MKVFIVEPKMTRSDVIYADDFNQEFIEQLGKYGVEKYEVAEENIVRLKGKITKEALVIVYNSENDKLDAEKVEVQSLLQKAIKENAQIWPVAINKSSRVPSVVISSKQSYDIEEQLRCRNLDKQYLKTIAKIFARKVIARVFPTCYCEEGEIFLSHRRIDGEDLTAKIYDKMLIQAREATPFRDVVNVKVGEYAQREIDKIMENSDVFVFIHTPKSGESDWILKELRFALLRNIPILWVQLDDADIKKLRVKPSDSPHLKYKTEEFSDDKKITKIVDEILQKAFELIMDRSNQILGYKEAIEELLGEKLTVVDQRKMIYHISMERKGYHYPQRNIEQDYQLFGRTPTIEDARKLKSIQQNKDSDSKVILTNRIVKSSMQENIVFDSIQDFYYHWSHYLSEMKGDKRMEIIISGAYPDADEIYKQSLTDALILFAKVIIGSGYELTFGAHPTFQELFYEIAKEIDPKEYKNKVNMYISEWFLPADDKVQKEEYNKKFNLIVSDKKDTLSESLSEMRKNMIQRKEVKALVCLGGKIKQNKNEEGIREEIKLACEMNIPVFLVGSVGGCSSEVALEYKHIGWNKLNAASDKLNQEFLEGINYYSMAQKMMNYLNQMR